MKILILGAGQVGSSLAENLAHEANDITIIDKNEDTLHLLQDRLDIRTVTGHASHPDILRAAGAEDADMLVAVTDSDETNMVACQVAYSVFHTPTKIARIRAIEYLSQPNLFSTTALPIDFLISPEQLITDYIKRLIEHPGALQVLDFADGQVQLVGVKAYYGDRWRQHGYLPSACDPAGCEAHGRPMAHRNTPLPLPAGPGHRQSQGLAGRQGVQSGV